MAETRRTPGAGPGFAKSVATTTTDTSIVPTTADRSTTVDDGRAVAAWLIESARAARRLAWSERRTARNVARWLSTGVV